MGKQSNKPTAVSQEQYNKDLDKSLEILHKDVRFKLYLLQNLPIQIVYAIINSTKTNKRKAASASPNGCL